LFTPGRGAGQAADVPPPVVAEADIYGSAPAPPPA
jgi:hypothetical protein